MESLPKGTIDLKRMKDANSVKRAQAVVRSVEFHPTASVLLTAGYHKTVDLFQVCADNYDIVFKEGKLPVHIFVTH